MEEKKKLSDDELLPVVGGGGDDDGVDLDNIPNTLTLSCPNCDYELIVSEIGDTPQYCPNCNLKLEKFEC